MTPRIAAATAFALSLGTIGCTIDRQSAPALSAPSEYSLSLAMTATPDVLQRDGQSTSLIQLVARDATGKPATGQRLILGATAGTLSETNVVTGSNGTVSVQLTAPPVTQAVSQVTISATPVGTNADNATTRTIAVSVVGPDLPVAAFNWSPGSPGQYDQVTFDASSTTLSGTACGSTCAYTWSFGDGGTATGQLVSHQFTATGSYSVQLTATAPGGLAAVSTRTVVVGAPQPITAAITLSPTNPKIGDTVYFNGGDSTTPDGVAITSYSWDFGNGVTGTGVTASTSYGAARTYTVRLTVVDALGRMASKTITVTVS